MEGYVNTVDKLAVNKHFVIVVFSVANVSDSLHFKERITSQTDGNATKNAEKVLPLKYLSNFWRILKILLITCEINLILTWSANCVIVFTAAANEGATLTVIETKLYFPVVTLSTQDNVKLFD